MRLSTKIKIACLAHLRFVRNMPLVATEAGRYSGDVVGVSEKEVVEFEIKISKADLRSDFVKKKSKHYEYQNAENNKMFAPNRFYFVVTPDLEEEAVRLCEEKGPRYGVYVYDPKPVKKKKKKASKESRPYFGRNSTSLRLSRKARLLHSDLPHPRLMDEVLLRSSSEMVGLYLSWEKLLEGQNDDVQPKN